MNDEDPFETRLRGLRRRDLAADWRAEVLSAAASAVARPSPSLAPPRWLAWSLAAAWMLVLAMNLMTPSNHPAGDTVAASDSTIPASLQSRQAMLNNLLALNLPSDHEP